MGLRFGMITTFYPPFHFGGDAIGLRRLCHGLARLGHEVTVFHAPDAWRMLSGRPDPEPWDEPDGVTVVPLAPFAPRLALLLTQQLGRPGLFARQLRSAFASGRFDVLNFHNISLAGGPGVLALGDAVKIYMAHEHWLVCPSHVLWRHGKEPCPERQCFRCVLSYRRPPQLWRYTGLLNRKARHVDAFIAMSAFSAEKHREFGFPFPMEVVPYFLPDDRPAGAQGAEEGAAAGGSSPHPRPYFLFVGRLELIKGLDDVLPVFRSHPDIELVIAGDGAHRPALEALAAGASNIRFLGSIDPLELTRWYRHAQALVVPSVCFETFGIILIEAMRQGTPVVARRIGPFPEIVESSSAGELFDGPDDLLGALRRLAGDPTLRESRSRAGRESFERLWSETAVMPRYLDVVRRAAEGRGHQRVVEVLDA